MNYPWYVPVCAENFIEIVELLLGDIITGRNEVVAKVMFLLVSVILYTGGGGVLSQHVLQVVSQHALQQVSGGVSALGGCLLWGGGCLLPGGVCSQGGICSRGVSAPGGMVAFWYGLLVWWPSD